MVVFVAFVVFVGPIDGGARPRLERVQSLPIRILVGHERLQTLIHPTE